MKPFLFVTLVFVLPAAVRAEAPAVKFRRGADEFTAGSRQVTVHHANGGESKATAEVWTFTSESGINGATLERPKEGWPERVIVRWRYSAERGFTILEGFELLTDTMRFSGSSRDSGKIPFTFVGEKPEQGQPAEATAAGTVNIAFRVHEGALEAALPRFLLARSEQVRIEWVDFYR